MWNQSNWITSRNKLIWMTAALFVILACNFGRSVAAPTSDLFATLQASTPIGGEVPFGTQQVVTTPVFNSITQKQKVAVANVVITNTGSYEDLWKQVNEAWTLIMADALLQAYRAEQAPTAGQASLAE